MSGHQLEEMESNLDERFDKIEKMLEIIYKRLEEIYRETSPHNRPRQSIEEILHLETPRLKSPPVAGSESGGKGEVILQNRFA